MTRSYGRFVRLAGMLLASALLFACDGSTGPAGPAGPSGSAAIPWDSVDRINVTIEEVTIENDGSDAKVTLRLTDKLGFGLAGMPEQAVSFTLAQLSPPPAAGASSEWQSYFTRDSGGIANAQATTEAATSGTFDEVGDGLYTYEFASDLNAYPAGPVFDSGKIHRIGVEIRTNRVSSVSIPANNAPYDFLPSPTGAIPPAPEDNRLIVNNAACNACHDNLEMHGEARFDVEYCVTCHNPYSIDGDTANEPWGGTVDMKRMIHKIHVDNTHPNILTNGYRIRGYNDSVHDYSDVAFPQDARNCQTCHQDSDPTVPQAGNWKEVQNRAACGSCHDWIDWDGSEGDPDLLHWGGFTFLEDIQCVDCHGPNSDFAGGDYRVAVVHTIPEAVAAEAFEYDVVSVTNTAVGERPIVRIRVLDPTDPNYAADPGSTAYDINDPTGPFQVGSARLRVDVAWNNDDFGNLDPNDDLARAPDSGAPFAPLSIDFTSDAANVGNNVFEKQTDVGDVIPSGVSGSGTAFLEGRPQVDLGDGLVSLAVAGNGMSFAITDAEPVDRRQVVNIDKCNDCHKNLSLHGDNRSGNTELCATCHNPNATDINRRAGACATDLGTDDEPIDLKVMVHRIHAGNIALCGYGNSTHDYRNVVYPGRLNNCEGCHLEDTFYPVDPTAVLATTVDAGPFDPDADPPLPIDRSTLTDDVAISPNSAVCSSCHTSDLARNHMVQNGGDFDAGKDDTGALISEGNETCQLCHGKGATADVAVMHGVGEFQYN